MFLPQGLDELVEMVRFERTDNAYYIWLDENKLRSEEDRLTLCDMNHYTTVKTNMFNGIQHPSIWLQPKDGDAVLLREFTYEDYRDRMS